MKVPRWTAISHSAFEWEREALDFLRDNLPDHEPWRAWSNFEFIDDEGRVNEVDALVLTPAGLILTEVKSQQGNVRGDAHSWTWRTEGREFTTDNPLPLANRKAKRLASVLRRQEALGGRHGARITPWEEPLIFLSKVNQGPALDPGTTKRVVLRGEPGREDDKERMRCAHATIRAAVELEASVSLTRFASYAEARAEAFSVLVAASPENAEYARRLGRAADKLAAETPLPSPGRVNDEIGVVPGRRP